MFGGAHSKCTVKIVMWFFKWNIALVASRLFTSRVVFSAAAILVPKNGFTTLRVFFRDVVSPAHCSNRPPFDSKTKTMSFITNSRAFTAHANIRSLHSMQMITHIHVRTHGTRPTVQAWKMCETKRKIERESSLPVHWFTPIINEADGTHSPSLDASLPFSFVFASVYAISHPSTRTHSIYICGYGWKKSIFAFFMVDVVFVRVFVLFVCLLLYFRIGFRTIRALAPNRTCERKREAIKIKIMNCMVYWLSYSRCVTLDLSHLLSDQKCNENDSAGTESGKDRGKSSLPLRDTHRLEKHSNVNETKRACDKNWLRLRRRERTDERLSEWDHTHTMICIVCRQFLYCHIIIQYNEYEWERMCARTKKKRMNQQPQA